MAAHAYLSGTDLLGASDDRFVVVVRVKNMPAVVEKQVGEGAGGLALWAAPQTVESIAYEALKKQLQAAFAKEGVQADVQVLESPPPGGVPPASDLGRGIAIGAAGAGVLWALLRFVVKPIFFR